MNPRFMLTQAEADFLHSLEKQFESSEVLPFATEIGNCVSWLNEELRVEELGTSRVISTPFLDRHNDEIEVYVEKLLRQHHIPVFRDLKLSGHSGFDHKFDFGIPGSESEAVLQAVNRLTRDHAASIAFMVSDGMRARGEGALVAYAFLNDEGNELNSDHIDALTAYNIRPLRWSKREEGVERLWAERKI